MSNPGRRHFLALALAAVCAPAGLPASKSLGQTLGQTLAQARPAAEGFLSVADDLPLMPGLAEDKDAATLFDKPGGRILTAEARGAVSRQTVAKFYADTLPQLGWRMLAADYFRREEEQLRLSYDGRDGALIVRFELVPR